MIEDTKKMRGGLEEKERCNRKWKKKKKREKEPKHKKF